MVDYSKWNSTSTDSESGETESVKAFSTSVMMISLSPQNFGKSSMSLDRNLTLNSSAFDDLNIQHIGDVYDVSLYQKVQKT